MDKVKFKLPLTTSKFDDPRWIVSDQEKMLVVTVGGTDKETAEFISTSINMGYELAKRVKESGDALLTTLAHTVMYPPEAIKDEIEAVEKTIEFAEQIIKTVEAQ